MSENIKQNEKSAEDPRDKYFGGFILIAMGLLALLGNLVQSELLGLLILPTLGLIFLVWGFYVRRFGFIIPGCILSGLGFATLLSVEILKLDGTASGGVIVLGLGLGFIAMTFIAPLVNHPRQLWPLIPGGVLGFVGVVLLIGGDAIKLLEVLGQIWPLILVAVGLYIIFQPKKRVQ